MQFTIRKFYQSLTNPNIEIELTDLEKEIQANFDNPDYKKFIEIYKVVEIV